MKTVVTISLALLSALIVAGLKFEATEGQNVTIYFNIDEVLSDLVRITFKQDNKENAVVIAEQPWNHEETPPPGVSLLVEKGRVNVTIQNVSISRNSGLYTAEAFFGKYTSEVNATLVVIDPECVKERIGKAIAISMNGCGENTEDLLTVS
ncbi:hypothetical protein DPX16_1056 [Anabarilius grahami]|uniref:Uncharacterized protein n=1 Tax=Anabarilius grahami TaxID=495550 RepID=A0A3N0YKX8_ANAGA|nr:hypothetical protein DPX16_1056 [Anabarilius grahami]